MAANFQCPHCGTAYELSDAQVPQYAGQTIVCSQCGKQFTVAQNLASVPTAPPPPRPTLPYNTPHGAGTSVPLQPNGMAIVAVICGAISFCLPIIGSALAIIFGILALRKTRDPGVGGKTPAIVGITLGAASLILMPCMVSILLPSLNRARETANRVKCASNLRQLGMAMLLYANENRGAYPPRIELILSTQDVTPQVFACPASHETPAGSTTVSDLHAAGNLSYVYVAAKLNISASADAVLIYEPITNHGKDGGNVLFGDGHVEFIAPGAKYQQMVSDLQAGRNPPPALARGAR